MPDAKGMRSPYDVLLDVLAPDGIPIFEWPHETTPSAREMNALVVQIVHALQAEGWRFLDTTRIPSDTPQSASKPSNPSDTHDPPSVGSLENVSPQSEQVEADKGEG